MMVMSESTLSSIGLLLRVMVPVIVTLIVSAPLPFAQPFPAALSLLAEVIASRSSQVDPATPLSVRASTAIVAACALAASRAAATTESKPATGRTIDARDSAP